MKNVYLAYFLQCPDGGDGNFVSAFFKTLDLRLHAAPSGRAVAHLKWKDVVVSEFGLMAQTFLNDVEQKSQLLA